MADARSRTVRRMNVRTSSRRSAARAPSRRPSARAPVSRPAASPLSRMRQSMMNARRPGARRTNVVSRVAARTSMARRSNSRLNANVSRRDFLRTAGIAAAGVGAAAYGFGGVASSAHWSEYLNLCGYETYPLTAGQTIPVGSVEVAHDANYLYVVYTVTGEWCIEVTHFWAGYNLEDVPHTDNKWKNPIPGSFPYSSDDQNPNGYTVEVGPSNDDCVKTHTYIIPLSQLNLDNLDCPYNLYFVPHAAIYKPQHNCDTSAEVYGIERTTAKVWKVDVLTGNAVEEFTIPLGGNRTSPNGLGYDSDTDTWYYTEYQLRSTPDILYSYNKSRDPQQQVVCQLVGQVACGDFENGKYYYIPNGSDNLYVVDVNTCATTIYEHIASGNHAWSFSGDIAVEGNMVYGWGLCSHGYEYFTFNLDNEEFHLYPKSSEFNFSLQLALGSDGTLYGHESRDPGYWYEVDKTNGSVTQPSPYLPPDPYLLFTDASSGYRCVPGYDDETAYGGEVPGPFGQKWWFYDEYTVECCGSQPGCNGETAFGGNSVGPVPPQGNQAWWFYYDTNIGGAQTIWAGQQHNAGTVEIVNDTVHIVLAPNWQFRGTENVKINGYDTVPPERPVAGLFPVKKTFQPNQTDVWVPLVNLNVIPTYDISGFMYYVIHMDLDDCRPPQ